MKFRVSQRPPLFCHACISQHRSQHQRRCFTSFVKKLQNPKPRASTNGETGNSEGSNPFVLPGATVATIVMLGLLHARRLYDDKKIEEARQRGIEFEFQPDLHASFLRILPLRTISRCWGFLTSLEIPVWLRPHVYRAWARAFHTNLEEIAMPLEDYSNLREFFIHSLREGSRPFDPDPQCLVSPVDGIVLRYGELKQKGAIIEQVKGCSYSLYSLLGARSLLPMMSKEELEKESSEPENPSGDEKKNSWWRVSLASPKLRDPMPARPMKGLFYCVLYLRPGDYHRVHSPVDWHVLVRRHFSGHLFPLNERATRTISNLYVQNERVVLEGQWQEGFMAVTAVGATNIGSIELFIEPELITNRPRKKLLSSERPEERIYEPEGVGVMLQKGDELAGFNMGSTVVLIFQAPLSSPDCKTPSSGFRFCVRQGDRIRVGQALGRWRM